jgi:hypothetical protein
MLHQRLEATGAQADIIRVFAWFSGVDMAAFVEINEGE